MGINATLIGQLITFAIFIWFTMRFIWPPISNAMQAREQRIAAGLLAAEQGQQLLAQTRQQIEEQLRTAKQQAVSIVEQADKRAMQIIAIAKDQAKLEHERLLALARTEVEQEWASLKQKLQHELVDLVVLTTSQLLARAPEDIVVQHELIKRAIAEI